MDYKYGYYIFVMTRYLASTKKREKKGYTEWRRKTKDEMERNEEGLPLPPRWRWEQTRSNLT